MNSNPGSIAIRQLAKRLKPRGKYPANTKFGARFRKNAEGKRLAASCIVHELIKPGCDLYLGDGSSALWVGIAILTLNLNPRILTNNLAFASEVLFWPKANARVVLSQGQLNSEYGALYGRETDEFCEEAARESSLAIVPVTFLTFREGPCAGDPDARVIKQRTMINAKNLILVCDSTKMGHAATNDTAPVFSGKDSRFWRELRDCHEAVTLVVDFPTNSEHWLTSEVEKFQKLENWSIHALTSP